MATVKSIGSWADMMDQCVVAPDQCVVVPDRCVVATKETRSWGALPDGRPFIQIGDECFALAVKLPLGDPRVFPALGDAPAPMPNRAVGRRRPTPLTIGLFAGLPAPARPCVHGSTCRYKLDCQFGHTDDDKKAWMCKHEDRCSYKLECQFGHTDEHRALWARQDKVADATTSRRARHVTKPVEHAVDEGAGWTCRHKHRCTHRWGCRFEHTDEHRALWTRQDEDAKTTKLQHAVHEAKLARAEAARAEANVRKAKAMASFAAGE